VVFVILTILWLAIFACIAVLVFHTQKGRKMFKVLWRSRKVRLVALIPPVLIGGTFLVFFMLPAKTAMTIEGSRLFMEYSRGLVETLQEQGAITIDSACTLDSIKPELAYMLPALVSVYHEEVKKPTTARLVQLSDTLRLSFDGYKQFKNRTILIIKGAKKRLGPRYTISMNSAGKNHELTVTYGGEPWNNEQLCALPATQSAIRENVDPAILMSLIRHISGFDFNHENEDRKRGLLALDSGEGLEQIFIGAKRLRQTQDSGLSEEDAIATFYPDNTLRSLNSEWRESPLKRSWVKEVLADVPYYHNNGLRQ